MYRSSKRRIRQRKQKPAKGDQFVVPSAPRLSLRLDEDVGLAAGDRRHLRRAGAEVVFSTVLGDDALRDFVITDLEANGIDCHAIVDPTRPTTRTPSDSRRAGSSFRTHCSGPSEPRQ